MVGSDCVIYSNFCEDDDVVKVVLFFDIISFRNVV